jgi:hypothetical protein
VDGEGNSQGRESSKDVELRRSSPLPSLPTSSTSPTSSSQPCLPSQSSCVSLLAERPSLRTDTLLASTSLSASSLSLHRLAALLGFPSLQSRLLARFLPASGPRRFSYSLGYQTCCGINRGSQGCGVYRSAQPQGQFIVPPSFLLLYPTLVTGWSWVSFRVFICCPQSASVARRSHVERHLVHRR